ncbi:MAG TPA: isoprenylcysteine carboxylmethyltransferase family protein [Solimonas sp.]|jgi:protein-S-isoprenylcysteine O-methyltransferase Ste14
MSAFLLSSGRFFFRYRNAVFPIVLAGLCLATEPGRGPWSLPLDVIGLLVVLAGQVMRGWVIGYAYIRRGGVNKEVYADDLVTSGVFAMSRNPLYVGNLLIYGGLFLVQNSLVAYLIGGAFFLYAYWSIVLNEEAYLRSRFGEAYERYCQEVPRWWPKLSRARSVLGGMPFEWRRVIAKDYSTAGAWMFALVVILAHQAAAAQGWAAFDWAFYAWAALGVGVFVGLARFAKKRRWLEDAAKIPAARVAADKQECPDSYRIEATRRFWVTRLFCVGIVLLYLLSASYWHDNDAWITHLLTPMGIVLAAAGALGRLWSSSYASGNKNTQLLTVGPYSLMRNPLYAFSYVGGLGIAITTETLVIPLLFTIWFFWYYPKVVTGEERFLESQYQGEFRAYMQQVPRFVPRPEGFVEPPRWEMSPPAFRKSMQHVVWFVIAAVLLHGMHDLRIEFDWPHLITLF